MRKLSIAVERFPIAGTFTISRGSKTEAVVVEATISDGAVSGRGEGVPYAHYGETVESVMARRRLTGRSEPPASWASNSLGGRQSMSPPARWANSSPLAA